VKFITNHEEREEFLRSENLAYFKLVGGLGNQLFGLSRAHLLHKELGKKIAVDVTYLDHTENIEPEWVSWNQLNGWCEIIASPKGLQPPDGIWNLVNPLRDAPLKNSCYTGWRLSLEEVHDSGLFTPNESPFSVQKANGTALGMHIRGGDYKNSRGIGLLGMKYYRKALESIPTRFTDLITIYTDDLEYAASITDLLGSRYKIEYSHTSSPLGVLEEMSSADIFVGSNSTLSWWAAFFSRSKFKYLPAPMYLQDWYADKCINLSEVQYLDRFQNIFQEKYNYVLWNIMRR
jgi:Glycosyl transferase family 11